MYKLIRYCENREEEIIIRSQAFLLGAEPGNDIIVDEQNVPDIAVRLNVNKADCTVENLLNSSMVKLNGLKFKKAQILPGDCVSIGSSNFKLAQVKSGSFSVEQPDESGKMLQNLSFFSDSLYCERDVKTLLKKTMEIFIATIGGTHAFIFTLDSDGNPKVFVSSSSDDPNEQFSDTIVQSVIKTGKGICIPNALSDPAFSLSKSVSDLKLSSVICCPIRAAKKEIGIAYLGSTNTSFSYSEKDLQHLQLFSLIAGLLVGHVDLIESQDASIQKLLSFSKTNGIIGQSPAMKEIFKLMNFASESDISVLLEGETGTGKDVIAKGIHDNCRRSAGNYVVVNCSSLQGNLLESELFGHKKGAFTGATNDHLGLFETADGGTIFLDEIGEMPLETQAKLLRTLESGVIRPVGSSHEKDVDVRVICATNKKLTDMVKKGAFRQDLFYRLNQFTIHIPSLRERQDDSVMLAYFFLEKYKREYPAKGVIDFSEDTLRFIRHYEWPGNVRELSNAVHKAVVTSTNVLADISDHYRNQDINVEFDLNKATNAFQRDFISKALLHCQGNKEKTAQLLGMSRSTMFRYLASLEIN